MLYVHFSPQLSMKHSKQALSLIRDKPQPELVALQVECVLMLSELYDLCGAAETCFRHITGSFQFSSLYVPLFNKSPSQNPSTCAIRSTVAA
jgi:hypothetical protein